MLTAPHSSTKFTYKSIINTFRHLQPIFALQKQAHKSIIGTFGQFVSISAFPIITTQSLPISRLSALWQQKNVAELTTFLELLAGFEPATC